MNKPTICIDAGHGGINELGLYTTPKYKGKTFTHAVGYDLHQGNVFNEGWANRVSAYDLAARFVNKGYPVVFVADNVIDTSLKVRANRANKAHSEAAQRSIYISLHFNAGGGEGYEIFTSPNQTKSDLLATKIFNKTKEYLPGRKYRPDLSDGDPDKEAKFSVLMNTNAPAVLIEHEFFDNPDMVNDCVCLELIQTWNVATFAGCLEFFKEVNWIENEGHIT